MSMFQHGQEAAQQAAADSARRSQSNFIRMFIKEDGGKKVVRFLDGDNAKTEPCTFPEHDVWVVKKVKGKPRKVISQYTCLKVAKEDCPFCAEGPYTTRYAYTVLDRDGYKNKDDKQVKELRKLYVIGVKQFKTLETFRKEGLDGGPLKAQDIKIVRNGQGTATTYSYFAGKVGEIKVDAESQAREDFNLEPFDYDEVLKPISRADALNVLRGNSKADEDPAEVEHDDDDDEQIPF